MARSVEGVREKKSAALASVGTALVLVEWPERLGAALPARRIEVQMTAGTRPDERHAEVMLVGPDWEAVARMLAKWT